MKVIVKNGFGEEHEYTVKSEEYAKARKEGLTSIERWEEGIDHHPMSKKLMDFLKEHDLLDYNDYFCWKTGGDGDNGEFLMFQMDAFFEVMDKDNN